MAALPTVDAPSVHYNPKTGTKTFIPLENNPAVFTQLAANLGLSPHFTFYDVFTLTDTSYIPRPVSALILICPSSVYHVARQAEYEVQQPYTGSGPHEPVVWIRQTIGHACGLMSLLHAVLNINTNVSSEGAILPSTPLSRFRAAILNLDPDERARYLYNDQEIEAFHMAAARTGDSAVPSPTEDNFNHFITFVRGTDGHLWELNGGMKGPVDRGALAKEEEEAEADMISMGGLELGVAEFLKMAGDGDVGFSVVALAPKEG